jgi:hypothetical protein
MRRPYLLVLLACSLAACSSDTEKAEPPEQQAQTLQPYPVHSLPLGIRLDSLQKILHGHSALFNPVVANRLYRIIPLNSYDNHGYGAVELHPDSTIRTYYWYSNMDALTDEQKRYYSQPTPAADIKPVLAALTTALGEPKKVEPYPEEAWYTWRNDSASINLTLQKKSITLTKTSPGAPIVIDTTRVAPVPVAKPKAAVKKAAPKKKVVAKKKTVRKPVAKKAPVRKKTTRKR